jgi:hypothetical protein
LLDLVINNSRLLRRNTLSPSIQSKQKEKVPKIFKSYLEECQFHHRDEIKGHKERREREKTGRKEEKDE